VAFGTSLERFEARFPRLLGQARELSELFFQIVDHRMPNGIPGDRYPEATVGRLNYTALVQYHAAVANLAEPATALGSLALLRSLIDAWAHLFFIWGKGDLADAGCRAIRLELGLTADALSIARSAGSRASAEASIAQERLALLEAARSEKGCQGSRRSYSSVAPTVREMAKADGLDWLVPLWQTASQVVHGAAWDWLIALQPDGTNQLVYPSPAHRASRLNHLVILYNNVGQTSLLILGSEEGGPLRDAALALLGDRFLKRAIDGDYD
jgi:hypothetical protein